MNVYPGLCISNGERTINVHSVDGHVCYGVYNNSSIDELDNGCIDLRRMNANSFHRAIINTIKKHECTVYTLLENPK